MTTTTTDLDLKSINAKQFEELVYDLLHEEHFQNLQWRDGGADGGRDIVGNTVETDGSGFQEQRVWFCDAKLYSQGIGFDVIHSTLSKATAHTIDYLLFAAWPHLTPPAKDDLDRWKTTNKPRFKIRLWEKKDIEKLLFKHPNILKKYLPSIWSQQLEMDAYLLESMTVFKEFRDRVSVVWKNPDGRPFTDLIRLLPKGAAINKAPTIEMVDASQSLTDTERAFLFALTDALRSLEEVMMKVLNITEPTAVIQAVWQEHPGVRLLLPIPHTNVLRSDIKDGLGRMLAHFEEGKDDGKKRGVLTGMSSWKPYREKNRVAVYAIFPKELE